MTLQKELALKNPIVHPGQQVVLGVILTGAMLEKEGTRLLRPFKLTDAQFNVLMLLKYQAEDDGAVSQTRLGRMLLVNRSNVTGLVDRLEQARLLEREAKDGDRRVKRVRLTAAGRRLVDRAEQVYYQRVEALTAGLGAAEVERLCRMLNGIRERVK